MPSLLAERLACVACMVARSACPAVMMASACFLASAKTAGHSTDGGFVGAWGAEGAAGGSAFGVSFVVLPFPKTTHPPTMPAHTKTTPPMMAPNKSGPLSPVPRTFLRTGRASSGVSIASNGSGWFASLVTIGETPGTVSGCRHVGHATTSPACDTWTVSGCRQVGQQVTNGMTGCPQRRSGGRKAAPAGPAKSLSERTLAAAPCGAWSGPLH